MVAPAIVANGYVSRVVIHSIRRYIMDSGSRVLNLRSRCKHKAWGASPRFTNPKTCEPANAGDSVSGSWAVARSAGSHVFIYAILGLAPQALCLHLLRRLRTRETIFVCVANVISVNTPQKIIT